VQVERGALEEEGEGRLYSSEAISLAPITNEKKAITVYKWKERSPKRGAIQVRFSSLMVVVFFFFVCVGGGGGCWGCFVFGRRVKKIPKQQQLIIRKRRD